MHCLRRVSHSSSRSHAICTWALLGGSRKRVRVGVDGYATMRRTLYARHNSQARYRSRRRVHLLNIGIQQCQNVSMNKFRHKVAKVGYLSITSGNCMGNCWLKSVNPETRALSSAPSPLPSIHPTVDEEEEEFPQVSLRPQVLPSSSIPSLSRLPKAD